MVRILPPSPLSLTPPTRIRPRFPHPRHPARNPPWPPSSSALHHTPLYPALGAPGRCPTRGVSEVEREVLFGCVEAHAGGL